MVLSTLRVQVNYLVIQREISASAHRRTEGPVRTCVGCRKRELAVELLRVVAVSTGNGRFAVAVDPTGTVPGRGAWLHPVPQCATAAIRRRAFVRALRITGAPDTTAVVEHLEFLRASGRIGDQPTEQAAKNHEHTVKSR